MRDYMVTGEMNTNMLVSPDYLKTGGTILDMFTENPLSLSDTQEEASCEGTPAESTVR